MPYASGSVNSFAELVTAVQSACTSNGWTLAGSVLQKGTCYARLTSTSDRILVLGGTGIDGSNAITGAPAYSQACRGCGGVDITFPVTYEVLIGAAPDEVYLIINYAVNRYAWLGFGQSPAAGVAGTGNWQAACWTSMVNAQSINLTSSDCNNGALGWVSSSNGATSNSPDQATYRVQHGLDGNDWSDCGYQVAGSNASTIWSSRASLANCVLPIREMLEAQPNQWNQEAVLLPLDGWVWRGSSKVSKVTNHAHARTLRIDNYDPGSIITLGTDRWKVYPWVQKNTAARNGGAASPTGTLGWALRYDGS